jgi:hypothetical protein
VEGEGRLGHLVLDVIKDVRTRRHMPVARFPVLSSFVNHAFVSDTSLRLRPRLYAARLRVIGALSTKKQPRLSLARRRHAKVIGSR